MATWVWALLWTRAKEEDGYVSRSALRGAWTGERQALADMRKLVKVGLVEEVPADFTGTSPGLRADFAGGIKEAPKGARVNATTATAKKRTNPDEPTLRETLGARVLSDGTLQVVAGLTGRERALAFALGVAVYAVECADRSPGWRADLELPAALALAVEIVDGRPEHVGHGGRSRAPARLAYPASRVGA